MGALVFIRFRCASCFGLFSLVCFLWCVAGFGVRLSRVVTVTLTRDWGCDLGSDGANERYSAEFGRPSRMRVNPRQRQIGQIWQDLPKLVGHIWQIRSRPLLHVLGSWPHRGQTTNVEVSDDQVSM